MGEKILSLDEMIEGCLNDEVFLEAFADTFYQEFNSDEAGLSDKYGRLLNNYGDDEDLFITLTGWSLETLLRKSRGEDEE
jgi:hypothetical protein